MFLSNWVYWIFIPVLSYDIFSNIFGATMHILMLGFG
jgi:hypothetical protein